MLKEDRKIDVSHLYEYYDVRIISPGAEEDGEGDGALDEMHAHLKKSCRESEKYTTIVFYMFTDPSATYVHSGSVNA